MHHFCSLSLSSYKTTISIDLYISLDMYGIDIHYA